MGLRYHTQQPDKPLLCLIPNHHPQFRLSAFSACESSRLSTAEIKAHSLHTQPVNAALQSAAQASSQNPTNRFEISFICSLQKQQIYFSAHLARTVRKSVHGRGVKMHRERKAKTAQAGVQRCIPAPPALSPCPDSY